jgi:uncharacterized membrane protein YphA (DoxX/SURF4 family)
VPVCAVQGILAYEWLLSGVDKVANPHFASQLPTILRGSTLVNPYGWYSTLLKQFVLPHTSVLAPMVELAEIAIGLVLISGIFFWVRVPRSRIALWAAWAGIVALMSSALLALNYSFQQGAPLPWVNGAQAFGPGVGVDMLVALLSLPLLVANFQAIRATQQRHVNVAD